MGPTGLACNGVTNAAVPFLGERGAARRHLGDRERRRGRREHGDDIIAGHSETEEWEHADRTPHGVHLAWDPAGRAGEIDPGVNRVLRSDVERVHIALIRGIDRRGGPIDRQDADIAGLDQGHVISHEEIDMVGLERHAAQLRADRLDEARVRGVGEVGEIGLPADQELADGVGRDRELLPELVLDHHPLGVGENDLVKVALRRGLREGQDSPGREVRPGPAKVLRPSVAPGTNTAAASATRPTRANRIGECEVASSVALRIQDPSGTAGAARPAATRG